MFTLDTKNSLDLALAILTYLQKHEYSVPRKIPRKHTMILVDIRTRTATFNRKRVGKFVTLEKFFAHSVPEIKVYTGRSEELTDLATTQLAYFGYAVEPMEKPPTFVYTKGWKVLPGRDNYDMIVNEAIELKVRDLY